VLKKVEAIFGEMMVDVLEVLFKILLLPLLDDLLGLARLPMRTNRNI